MSNTEQNKTGGAQVRVEDHCIWTAHISGDEALVENILALAPDEEVVLAVDEVVGLWAKMCNGTNGRSTNGLKPLGDAIRAHWQTLFQERNGEEISIAILSASELVERLRDTDTTIAEKLKQAEEQIAQIEDGQLRARAEIENIRRRSQNEIVAARKYAIEGFAQELLGVRDSLDRASSVALDEGAGEAVEKMKEGLGLTLKQLDLAMARFAVVEVEAGPGVRFDPERHQAISTTPSAEIEADHIVSVVQKGFLLKERLLRPAMVVVASAVPSEEQSRDD